MGSRLLLLGNSLKPVDDENFFSVKYHGTQDGKGDGVWTTKVGDLARLVGLKEEFVAMNRVSSK